MDKETTILGKFYLKNGIIIDEKVVLDKSNSKETIENFIEETKNVIKTSLRDNIDFQFTFGFTIFRGSDISAVTITIE